MNSHIAGASQDDVSAASCAVFGDDAVFHHVGMAVRSIREVNPSLKSFPDETRGVAMAFLALNGITLELLEPLGDRSPIERSLQNGVKLLHLCYEVADLEEALQRCRPAGFHRLGPPAPAPAFGNRRIVWVFSQHYGLFELRERTAKPAPPAAH